MAPTINPALVPTVAPGNLFATLTQDTTLNIRFLTALDPVFFEVLNRPLADSVLRQLIIAKTLDQLSLSIGHQAMFPFLVQAKVEDGTTDVDVPPGWIWDLHMSLPAKWENFRLAKIKRISGVNGISSASGTLRCIITANQEGSTIEVAVFSADFEIDSVLTYQRARLTIVDSTEESTPIDPGESETVEGFITFRTLDQDDPLVEAFYEVLAPPADTTDTSGDGFFDTPAVYELVDTVPGGTGVSGDFSTLIVSHGTGLLVDSTENTIPLLESDVQSWINSFNYPFDVTANRTSTGTTAIQIPIGLFREFDITAPAGDRPTDDSSGLTFLVWISRIVAMGTDNNTLRFFFATFNVTDSDPAAVGIEFASMDLLSTMVSGEIVAIAPIENLKLATGAGKELFQQHFGRGHVVLSSLWGGTGSTVDDFFDEFNDLSDVDVEFTGSSTRLSSFGISRVPKYVPTIGQNQALDGTTSNLDTPVDPSVDNKYVTEQDQGLGNRIDLEAVTDIDPVNGIDRFGQTGALAHRVIQLCIDATKHPTGSEAGADTFYVDEILPRLRLLLGRDPKFGDFWFDGTRLKFFNGSTFIG